ncbi:MAG: phosphopantothenoylcysteine decarboxylase [Blautia faecis]
MPLQKWPCCSGAEVTLVSGPTAIAAATICEVSYPVTSARDMYRGSHRSVSDEQDIIIKACRSGRPPSEAVSGDEDKVKKKDDDRSISLREQTTF